MRSPKSETVSIEVRCVQCGYVQLWGLEQRIRGLVRAGKLRLTSDFDAVLVGELFRIHGSSIPCPDCGTVGSLVQSPPKKNQWTWADEVRCEDCGREIPPERVAAIPCVTRCVECQQEFER